MNSFERVGEAVDFFSPLLSLCNVTEADLFGLFDCHGIEPNARGYDDTDKASINGLVSDFLYLYVLGASYDDDAMDYCMEMAQVVTGGKYATLTLCVHAVLVDFIIYSDDDFAAKYYGHIKSICEELRNGRK